MTLEILPERSGQGVARGRLSGQRLQDDPIQVAAQRAAETLRARDHRGPIRVVCGEPVAPYDRPPLSKELRAEPFRPAEWYALNEVELLLAHSPAHGFITDLKADALAVS